MSMDEEAEDDEFGPSPAKVSNGVGGGFVSLLGGDGDRAQDTISVREENGRKKGKGKAGADGTAANGHGGPRRGDIFAAFRAPGAQTVKPVDRDIVRAASSPAPATLDEMALTKALDVAESVAVNPIEQESPDERLSTPPADAALETHLESPTRDERAVKNLSFSDDELDEWDPEAQPARHHVVIVPTRAPPSRPHPSIAFSPEADSEDDDVPRYGYPPMGHQHPAPQSHPHLRPSRRHY